jgi:hypothetical protein
MEAKQIRHDPFARQTLYRWIERDNGTSCRECGQAAKFFYGWQSDGSTKAAIPENLAHPWDGPFCTVVCYDSFNS